MTETADYCSCVLVVLEKTVVLRLTVTGPEADSARVIETVVGMLHHLVGKVGDWCLEHSMRHEMLD